MLSRLKTRPEFRKSRGLVRMNSGEIDKRTLVLDVEWTSPEDSELSGDEDDEDEGILDFHGNDGDDEDEDEDEDEEESDDEEEEDEDEDESEVELPPLPGKRKRPAEPSTGPAAPPKKRVTFDLRKPTQGGGPPSGSTLPNPGLKTATLTSRKRRKSPDERSF